jgi:hypothetical protein
MDEKSALEVRPFSSIDEYEGMIDYFLGAEDAFLRAMGVARAFSRREMPGCEMYWWTTNCLIQKKIACTWVGFTKVTRSVIPVSTKSGLEMMHFFTCICGVRTSANRAGVSFYANSR